MDWSLSTLWWLAAGALVAAELLSGTFYLLMVALGAAAGALAAHLGLPGPAQLAVAAACAAGCTAGWHWKRARHPQSEPAQRNADVLLDIGQTVVVRAWADDGSTRVHHRGSTWAARLAPGSAPRSGPHVIVAVQGNQLELRPAEPA